MGWRSWRFQSRSVSFCPLNAASVKSVLFRYSEMAFGSADRTREAASPIMRGAVHACPSSAVIRRENICIKRFCS
jgi:hypothetical protein